VTESAAGVPALAVYGQPGFLVNAGRCVPVLWRNIFPSRGRRARRTVCRRSPAAHSPSPAGMNQTAGAVTSVPDVTIVLKRCEKGSCRGKAFEAGPPFTRKSSQPSLVIVDSRKPLLPPVVSRRIYFVVAPKQFWHGGRTREQSEEADPSSLEAEADRSSPVWRRLRRPARCRATERILVQWKCNSTTVTRFF